MTAAVHDIPAGWATLLASLVTLFGGAIFGVATRALRHTRNAKDAIGDTNGSGSIAQQMHELRADIRTLVARQEDTAKWQESHESVDLDTARRLSDNISTLDGYVHEWKHAQAKEPTVAKLLEPVLARLAEAERMRLPWWRRWHIERR